MALFEDSKQFTLPKRSAAQKKADAMVERAGSAAVKGVDNLTEAQAKTRPGNVSMTPGEAIGKRVGEDFNRNRPIVSQEKRNQQALAEAAKRNDGLEKPFMQRTGKNVAASFISPTMAQRAFDPTGNRPTMRSQLTKSNNDGGILQKIGQNVAGHWTPPSMRDQVSGTQQNQQPQGPITSFSTPNNQSVAVQGQEGQRRFTLPDGGQVNEQPSILRQANMPGGYVEFTSGPRKGERLYAQGKGGEITRYDANGKRMALLEPAPMTRTDLSSRLEARNNQSPYEVTFDSSVSPEARAAFMRTPVHGGTQMRSNLPGKNYGPVATADSSPSLNENLRKMLNSNLPNTQRKAMDILARMEESKANRQGNIDITQMQQEGQDRRSDAANRITKDRNDIERQRVNQLGEKETKGNALDGFDKDYQLKLHGLYQDDMTKAEGETFDDWLSRNKHLTNQQQGEHSKRSREDVIASINNNKALAQSFNGLSKEDQEKFLARYL